MKPLIDLDMMLGSLGGPSSITKQTSFLRELNQASPEDIAAECKKIYRKESHLSANQRRMVLATGIKLVKEHKIKINQLKE